jgi:hypothetical protein
VSEDVPPYGDPRPEPQRSIVVGDAEYLKALSGYKQKTTIAAWCTRNRIKFFRNAQGWPVTTEAEINGALHPGSKAEPDWKACDNRPTRRRHG